MTQADVIDGFAPWMGIWGGVLSTVLAVFQVRSWLWRRFQVRLRLKVTAGVLVNVMGAGQPPRDPKAELIAVNYGRANVFLRRVGARKSRSWARFWRPVEPVFRPDFEPPLELGAEGRALTIPHDSYFDFLANRTYQRILVEDTLGRRWVLPRHELRKYRDP